MKKLSREQLIDIGHDVFEQMCPEHKEGDELNPAELIVNASLNAIINFMVTYQDELEK